MKTPTIGKDQIRAAIHSAALRRNGDRGAEIKEMLGDVTKRGIYMNVVSGNGLPLEQISKAMRNRISADDVLTMKALVGLAEYGLRLTEEAAVDDHFRGFVGESTRIPTRLSEEIDQRRKVYRAREKAWQERRTKWGL